MKDLLTAEDDFLKQISGLSLQCKRRNIGSASQGIKILLKVLLISLSVKLVAESLNGSCYCFINDKWILDHFLEEKNTQKRNEEQKETQDSIKKTPNKVRLKTYRVR